MWRSDWIGCSFVCHRGGSGATGVGRLSVKPPEVWDGRAVSFAPGSSYFPKSSFLFRLGFPVSFSGPQGAAFLLVRGWLSRLPAPIRATPQAGAPIMSFLDWGKRPWGECAPSNLRSSSRKPPRAPDSTPPRGQISSLGNKSFTAKKSQSYGSGGNLDGCLEGPAQVGGRAALGAPAP